MLKPLNNVAFLGIGIAFLPEIVAESEVERGELVVLPANSGLAGIYTDVVA